MAAVKTEPPRQAAAFHEPAQRRPRAPVARKRGPTVKQPAATANSVENNREIAIREARDSNSTSSRHPAAGGGTPQGDGRAAASTAASTAAAAAAAAAADCR